MNKILYNLPEWVVKEVRALDNFKLWLRFESGEIKIFDFKPYLKYKIYEKLNIPEFFKLVRVEGDSIAWPGDIDIAPERLYSDGEKI